MVACAPARSGASGRPTDAPALTGLAVVAARRGDLDTAGRLWGLILDKLPRAALPRPEVLHELAAPIAGLTDDGFLAAVEAGRSSTIDEAVALAVGEFEAPQP